MAKKSEKNVCKCGNESCKEEIKEIVITVEGGVIQEIDNPTNHKIIVRDYDIEGSDEDALQEDDNGNEYIESEW